MHEARNNFSPAIVARSSKKGWAGLLYAVYGWKTKRNVLKSYQGSKLNFFDNLAVGQMLSNVYLPKKISTCPKKKVL